MWSKKATDVHNNSMATTKPEVKGEASTQVNIEHLTYDETHVPRPRHREEVTEKIKIYISRFSRSSDELKTNSSGTPKSPWSLRSPWASSSTPSTPRTPKSPWSTRSQWSPKEWRQSLIGTQTTVTAGPVDDNLENKKRHTKGLREMEITTVNTTTQDTQENKIVGLRKRDQVPKIPLSPLAVTVKSRRAKFREIVKDKWTRASRALETGKTQNSNPSMEKIHALRKRIAEGKMEKVIRPLNASSYENGGRLPPPPRTPPRDVVYQTEQAESIHSHSSVPRKSNESSRFRCHSRSRKSKSTSSTIASLFESGAEGLDATRRELQEKFKPPFEHLNYPSFSLSRKASKSEAASSVESFYCMGYREDEQKANNKAIRELKRRQSERRGAVVMGSSPWALEGENRQCRLCGQKGVERMRNLCGDCESDFLQRREQSRSRTPLRKPVYMNNSSDEEIKPIAPPSLMLETSQSEIFHLSRFHEGRDDSSDKPAIPGKSRARYSASFAVRTPIVQPKPYSPSSQYGDIEIGTEEVPQRLQKRPSEDEFERAQDLFKRWSKNYGDTVLEEKDVDETNSAAHDWEKRKNRDTGFYGFWDDLLADFEPENNNHDKSRA